MGPRLPPSPLPEDGLHLICLVLGGFRQALRKAQKVFLVLGANDLESVVPELHRKRAKVAQEAHHQAPLDPGSVHVDALSHQDEIWKR